VKRRAGGGDLRKKNFVGKLPKGGKEDRKENESFAFQKKIQIKNNGAGGAPKGEKKRHWKTS